MEQTYWSQNGKHQALFNALMDRLPAPLMSSVSGKENEALERFRKAARAYLDCFGNGGKGRYMQIRHSFGVRMSEYETEGCYGKGGSHYWDKLHFIIEPIMDRLIIEAAAEQLQKLPLGVGRACEKRQKEMA